MANGTVIGSSAETGGISVPVDLKIKPTTIKGNAAVVQISGKINSLFTVTDCNVEVVGALGLRQPD
jgi:hypothetical protein